MKRMAAVITSVLALSGCMTSSQQRANHISEVWKATITEAKACSHAVFDAPESAPIRARRPFDIRDATLQQLNDGSFASNDEIKAIYATYPKLQACRRSAVDALAPVTPTVVPIFSESFHADDENLLALVNRKQTWGQYIQKEQENLNVYGKELSAEIQRISTGLRQSYQAEVAQRQQAIQEFQTYLQNQQLINAVNRPAYTTCSTFGNTTNCVGQ